MGVLVTAENLTRAMEADAAAVGQFEDELASHQAGEA